MPESFHHGFRCRSPSFLYRATVNQDTTVNNLIALVWVDGLRLPKAWALVLEYNLCLNDKSNTPYNSPNPYPYPYPYTYTPINDAMSIAWSLERATTLALTSPALFN